MPRKQLETSAMQNAFLTTGQHSERQVRKRENQPGLAEGDRSCLEEVRFQPELCGVEK